MSSTSTNSNELPEQVRRWRLILGRSAEEELGRSCRGGCPNLSEDQIAMDEALAAIYDETEDYSDGQRSAGLGASSPKIAKWLGDVRTYFTEDVVSVIQSDAIERKGLTQLLFEPEMLKNVQPNVQLVGTLMSLRGQIPERTKETARMVVRSVVDRIKLELEHKIRQAVTGALNRGEHSPIPHADSIDWKWTIGRNLKNYNPQLGKLIPERVYFFSRAQRRQSWTVIVDMDQSGSMADSVVYGAVVGSIFASLPALKTHVVAFDTEVVDLSEQCGDDPVDMLFGVQLGGGTDINKSVAYCERFIESPAETLFILLTDLYEGGNQSQLVRRMDELVGSGVRVLCLLALSDSGVPSYDAGLAKKLADLGIPCFGCTPERMPELVSGALRGDDLTALASRLTANG
ncbi:MAG: VWA domain-containing protein [Rhodopirellula sp. JB044]|uniref:VWA domain-containing protein n=1 Tax=Rhodopirellula sp. JB044 TaxID=3342844 RepID=UPI00370B570E